jgi:hypothetical protein
MGGRGQEVEDEFTYNSDDSLNREEEPESREEGGWWTPDLSWLQPEEEDEEEMFFLNTILSEEPEIGKADQTLAPSLRGGRRQHPAIHQR